MTSIPTSLATDQARTRLGELVVVDVRTPAEYASGHLPGAVNIPLDHLRAALDDIRHAAERRDLLVVCASGARSESACKLLAEEGVTAATLVGGTGAWAAAGHDLDTPAACDTRAGWSMERQVRFTAGSVVLLGLLLGVLVHPALLLIPAGIAGGLVFSAVTNTCGMAVVLGKLPHNRPRTADLDAARAELRGH
ncbi:rhodanese-like domain-containing protein [Streptomyces sp. CMB-StM0423]|uniref:rhodanese-like domain-containing protein n=1 Tax=Streptomyces sp. CMB-StM0423 TaxID=2059884 RepID=UPI000C7150B7|nr:rhodanese-like domain-containing protein [Streptomyces sp. CMB-StM0423]AUH40864.1 transporter [Streptomyces sp. CMB-StM0423]